MIYRKQENNAAVVAAISTFPWNGVCRWVERNFNASCHGFLARGKTEAFSEDETALKMLGRWLWAGALLSCIVGVGWCRASYTLDDEC